MQASPLSTLQHTATHCNTLQHTALQCIALTGKPSTHSTTQCNTVQHGGTQYIIMQHSAIQCDPRQNNTTHRQTRLRGSRTQHTRYLRLCLSLSLDVLVPVSRSMLQCVVVCCSVLQCVSKFPLWAPLIESTSRNWGEREVNKTHIYT